MSKETEVIAKALVEAEHYNLQTEVVHSALKHQAAYPDASIEECMQVALDEWDLGIY